MVAAAVSLHLETLKLFHHEDLSVDSPPPVAALDGGVLLEPPVTEQPAQPEEEESENENQENMETSTIRLKVGGKTFTATLVDNSSTRALKALLAEGDLTIEMEDYARMEWRR